MRFWERKKEPFDPGAPQIDIQPDVVVDREWDEEDGIHVRVAKPGWSWVIRWPNSPKFLGIDIGEADSYEQALDDALERLRQ